MLSISNLKMNEATQFKCEKCQTYFKKKEGLEKHLKRKFPCVKDTTIPQISIEVPQISTEVPQISTEEDKYIQSPVEKIQKVKKVKKTPAPVFKYTIVPPTTETDIDMSLSVQPVPNQECICPMLKAVLTNLKEDRKNNTPPTQMITEALYYSNDNLFEYNKDLDKTIISEEELDNFIEKCETLDTQMEFYFKMCKRTFNSTTGIYNDKELDRLYILNEFNEWEWSESKLINKIRCCLYDTINTAVANSALVYRNYADRLMAIKRINYEGNSSNEINDKLLIVLKL